MSSAPAKISAATPRLRALRTPPTFPAMPLSLPLSKMTRSEKLIAMESLWQDLSRDEAKLASPAWHADALKETERLVKSGKAKFSDWDEAKARIKRAAARLT